MSIYIVYKTNAWHSYDSRNIIGVATTPENAIKICKLQAKKEGCRIHKEELFNLNNTKQTQGYKGEGEFQYEEMETDTLL